MVNKLLRVVNLKKYLLEGYAVNEKRILEAKNKFQELQQMVDFLKKNLYHFIIRLSEDVYRSEMK